MNQSLVRPPLRIMRKADRARTMRVAHVSSPFTAAVVSEILPPLTLMMNAIGIETDWHLIQGTRDFLRAPKSYTTHCKAFL